MLFDGENNKESNDSNAKTVVFFSLVMTEKEKRRIVLFGLRNGSWNDKLLKH